MVSRQFLNGVDLSIAKPKRKLDAQAAMSDSDQFKASSSSPKQMGCSEQLPRRDQHASGELHAAEDVHAADGRAVSTEQLRHQAFTSLDRPRELVLVCPDFKSNVNLSRIVRLAGCCAVEKIIASGNGKIDPTIARDAMTHVMVERRRSLLPVLKKLRSDGYRLVGLEQTDRSTSIHEFSFPRRIALVIGHERLGIPDDQLSILDDIVELPIYGLPYSLNVVTATTMAVYEYCKQFPRG